MSIPTVYVVGADKGGVGKTTVSRLLIDYFRATGVNFKAFDTESPTGGLKRFFPAQTEIVDLTKSSDQIQVFDNIGVNQATVIDIRAGLLTPTIKLLSEVGFLEAAKANKLRMIVLHVIGPDAQSLDEVTPMIAALNGARHIVVANHINDTEFKAPDGAIDIAKLDGLACKEIDTLGISFTDYVNTQKSFMSRGKTRNWVAAAFAEFDRAKLNETASLI